MDAEARLKELGIELPELPSPAGNYVGAVAVDKLVFVSGQGPMRADGGFVTGKVPGEVSLDEAVAAARLVGLASLAALKAEIGDLDRVECVAKVLGMVNAAPDFKLHPQVIDGYSDLMVEVFGEAG